MTTSWEELVQQIKQRLDIVEVVSEYVVLKKRGNSYVGICPFHNDKNPSMRVTPHMGIYKCFSCGEGGDALRFLMKIRNIDFKELIIELADRFGLELPQKGANIGGSTREMKDQMITAMAVATEYYNDLLIRNKSDNAQIALNYLTERGIGSDIIKKYHIGISPKSYFTLYNELKNDFSNEVLEKAGLIIKSDRGNYIDRFSNRIMVPIQNEYGDFVAFGARTLEKDSKTCKYLNSSDSPIYNKSKLLYGLYNAKDSIKEKDSVILMEGYFDVISSQAHGITNCVASCGTALTPDHVKLLSRYTKSRKIYLSFDTDVAGQTATARGAQVIKEVFAGLGDVKQLDESYVATDQNRYACEIRVIAPPEGKDPDEFVRSVGADAYMMYVEHAPLLIDFQIDNILKQKNNYNTPQEKAQYISQIVPILCDIKNKIIRSEYIDKVAQTIGIDKKALTDEVNNFERTQTQAPVKIIKNVTKSSSIIEKTQKILLSVFLVADSPLTFTQINEMLEDITFENKILQNVKSTIDKSIYTVNNVKELVERLYTEYVEDQETQTLLQELIALSEVYRGLEEDDFRNVITETISKMEQCKQKKEKTQIKNLYRTIDDNDPEALKIQMKLRDNIIKERQNLENN